MIGDGWPAQSVGFVDGSTHTVEYGLASVKRLVRAVNEAPGTG